MPDQDARLVSFSLDEFRLAVPLRIVDRIIRAVRITPLPEAPDAIMGAIDFHGSLMPVMDLRKRLGMPSRKLRSSDRFMILQLKDRQLALQVDDILEVITAGEGHLFELDLHGADRVKAGIVRTEEGLAIIYDPERFLSSAERAGLDEALKINCEGGKKP